MSTILGYPSILGYLDSNILDESESSISDDTSDSGISDDTSDSSISDDTTDSGISDDTSDSGISSESIETLSDSSDIGITSESSDSEIYSFWRRGVTCDNPEDVVVNALFDAISNYFGRWSDASSVLSDSSFEDYSSSSDDLPIIRNPVPAEVVENFFVEKYDENLKTKSDLCSICKENFKLQEEVLLLPCGHAFHDNCIKNWFQEQNTCPNCREIY